MQRIAVASRSAPLSCCLKSVSPHRAQRALTSRMLTIMGPSRSHIRGATRARGAAECQLFGSDHHDLDERARVGELRLDAGAGGQVLAVGPRRPDLVHRRAVTDVTHPYLRLEQLRLVRAALREQPVDLL